ncbi:MAG: NAD(P)-dependent oxidoreductase [Armatimonadetes bacterium]|nr:NAD(P)-dependent oxidoreductase [Armatimonadota bacterium]
MNIQSVALFGGSGKIGRRFIPVLQERGIRIRALIHKTPLEGEGIECIPGTVSDPTTVREVVSGTDAVLQLATTKEDETTFFDVSVRGTLNILEACRFEGTQQFVLLGGDAAFGIWFYPQPIPIDESHPLMAYPGYYAFTKVMEEVMTTQYAYQYSVPFTILRSSWVFEKADLLNHFSLLKNVDPAEPGHGFGQQPEAVMDLVRAGKEHIPVLVNKDGVPYRRHIVHIEDLAQAFDRALGNPSALGQSFNIAAPAAFDYRVAADYLASRLGLPTIELTCSGYHSFEINISRARSILGYQPRFDFFAMADSAIDHARGDA